ncbi:cytochrome c-type biogenesis protein [Halioxenophilus sp. WMMB6]|uniref:cytochrome c-type biogenesis protein n=1 Tax=Halioxenophilus sp. WMMB6 TaxID=3073815 RepID=UPI00295E4368|nr:cytochrome c-type biogenesis protein [Halioxenophilus sp. WMMB6]
MVNADRAVKGRVGYTVLLSVLLRGLVLGLLSCAAYGVVDVYDFDTPEQEARYEHLINVLRCPKCQNQSLNGSDSQIAKDLRRELHRMILEGQNDAQIKDFMVSRYGDYVLYEPRLTNVTVALWFGPAILLLIGLIVLIIIVRRRAKPSTSAAAPLTEAEQQRLQNMLSDSEQKGN